EACDASAVISMRPVSCFRPSLIASIVLPAQPVSTVTQGRAVSYEIPGRQSVQRRGRRQRRGLHNKLELGSAQRLISVQRSPTRLIAVAQPFVAARCYPVHSHAQLI